MPSSRTYLAVTLVMAGLTGALAAGQTTGSQDDQQRCDIVTQSVRGMIRLQGVVHSDEKLIGHYRFTVASAAGSGSTNISQGGLVAAGPDAPATLGMVMLPGQGAYNVRLEVTADGKTFECAKRAGGAI